MPIPLPNPLAGKRIAPPVWTPALIPGIQAWWRAQPELITGASLPDVDNWASLINGSSDDRSISYLAGNHAQYTAPDNFVDFTPTVFMQSLLPMIASLPLDMRSVWATFSLTATNSAYRVMQSWDVPFGPNGFACGVDPTEKLFASNQANLATGTTSLLDDGTLYRAVFSIDDVLAQIQLYLNGVNEATAAFSTVPSTRLLVGAGPFALGFKGHLNELILSRSVATHGDILKYQTYSVTTFGP